LHLKIEGKMVTFITSITTKVISGLLVKAGVASISSAISTIKSKKNVYELYNSLCEPSGNHDYAKNVINKVFTFRTIIYGDRDVFLDQIYHPLKLTSPEDEVVVVDDNFTLPEHTSSCLVGYAGQGKTITMKKMFLEDLNKNVFFPLFISLRAIDFSSQVSVPEVLLQHFKAHGVKTDVDSVIGLLKQLNNIRVYFDGFDEIHHDERDNALALLDECISLWKMNVICSSRPDTQVCKKPGFLVYNVQFLNASDVEEIININVINVETKSTLLTILHGKDFLLDSIKSPILVDIFIVTSIGLGKKPENIVSYYESLFSSLVYKHDFNKIFTRARKSDLTDTQMEQCLSYFAFIAQLKQQTNFAYSDMVEAFIDAKDIIGKGNDDEKAIIEDVIEITNLITRDGYDNYTFIHKSIQDFYAAKFISTSAEENQIDFFHEIKQLRPDVNFCYMLKSLIPSAYYPHFIKLKIDDLGFKEDNIKYPVTENVIKYLEDAEILFDKENEHGDGGDTFKIVGIVNSISKDDFPFSIIDDLKEYMFLRQVECDPITSIFSYWSVNKLNDIKYSSLVEGKVRQSKDYSASFEMTGKEFISIFPDFVEFIKLFVKDVSGMIDSIFEEYNAAIEKVNSKNVTTQRVIKALMKKNSK